MVVTFLEVVSNLTDHQGSQLLQQGLPNLMGNGLTHRTNIKDNIKVLQVYTHRSLVMARLAKDMGHLILHNNLRDTLQTQTMDHL